MLELGTLLLLGLAGAVVAGFCVLRPRLGLFLFVLLLYARVFEVAIKYYGAPQLSHAFAALLITSLALNFGARAFDRLHLGAWLPLVVYGIVLLSSTLVAADLVRAMPFVIDYATIVVFIMVIVLLARGVADLRAITWAMITAGASMAIITIYQVASGSTNAFFGFGQLSAQIVVPGELQEELRPAGSIGDPNFYALILVPLVPLALHRMRYERSTLMRGLAVVSASVSSVAIVLTYSRGGMLSLGIALGLAALLGLIHFRILAIAGLVMLLALPLLPASYRSRAATLTEISSSLVPDEETDMPSEAVESVSGRVIQMKAGMRMFLDHPILGVGVENYPVQFQEYARPLGFDKRTRRAPHSLYIEILAETGLLGFSAFLLVLGSVFARLYQSWRFATQPELRDLSKAVAAGLCGFLVGSIFLHAAYPLYQWMLVGFALATHAVAHRRVVSTVNAEPRILSPVPA